MWINKCKALLHSDFAFRKDTTLAALPLVIAFLTVLSICMTHSAAYIKHVTLSGSEALEHRLHLHLPYDTSAVQLQQLYEALSAVEGIEMIEEIPENELKGFLRRWMSVEVEMSDEFPLPIILDITLIPDVSLDMVKADIQGYVQQHIPGALLESYDETISAFNQSSHMVKTGIYILGFVVMISITLIVVITSRINLGVHRRHIEILHHLGASDQYINRQFLKRSAMISGIGILGGTLLSLAFVELLKSRFAETFLPVSGIELGGMWIYYLLNPLLLLGLVLAAAWVSIEAQLKKMH